MITNKFEFPKIEIDFFGRSSNNFKLNYLVYNTGSIFPLILNGNPSTYSIYTRSGIGYTTSSTEVPENEPMGDITEGKLKYFNYAGTGEFLTTVNTSYLSLNATQFTPFRSSSGTDYGIQGLFEGVDTNNAFGRIIIEDFKTSDISTNQNLILTYTDVPILWIEATTGLIKASDGTTTIESNSGISVDTNYKIELIWDGEYFWISLNNVYGTASTFDGSFSTIGTAIKYSEDGIYHTVRSVWFSNKLDGNIDTFLRDYDYTIITDQDDTDITI